MSSRADSLRVTIAIAVSDETTSLEQTVDLLKASSQKSTVKEIILVAGSVTTQACRRVCAALCGDSAFNIRLVEQTFPGAGGAYQTAFAAATGTHLIMLAGDLETDPRDVDRLIEAAAMSPGSIICTTRWKGSFQPGYHPVKLAANFIFQYIFRILYRTNLTDMTFGYRLYPTDIIQNIHWEEYFHPFFLESIIKPLRLGVPAIEIPTTWKPRPEGVSHNSFFKNFYYFKIGLRVLWMDRNQIIRHSTDSAAGFAKKESLAMSKDIDPFAKDSKSEEL